ncbi:MAG: acyltransferase family protein [Desulfobaccales bacterium]
MDKYKVNFITFMQSFGVTLVVFTHSIYITPIPIILYWIGQWIGGFYMPLFFFIAGYLFILTNQDMHKINIISFIIKKFKRIIIPYLILTSLAFGPKILLTKYALKPLDFNIRTTLLGYLYPDLNPIVYFWFLPTIFLIYMVALGLYRTILPITLFNSIVIIPILLYLNIFNPLSNIKLLNISGVTHYLIFFWLGSWFLHFEKSLDNLLTNKYTLLILLLITVILTSIYNHGKGTLLRGLFGIMLSISLGKYYVNNNWSFFRIIDGYYYQIFLLSWFFITSCRILLYHQIGLSVYITDLAMFISGLFFPVVLSYFINRRMNFIKLAIGM